MLAEHSSEETANDEEYLLADHASVADLRRELFVMRWIAVHLLQAAGGKVHVPKPAGAWALSAPPGNIVTLEEPDMEDWMVVLCPPSETHTRRG